MNECSRTPYRTFTNKIERTRPLFMFVHLTNRTKFLVHVRSFIKRTNINELPAERFTNCSLNVRFVYSITICIGPVSCNLYEVGEFKIHFEFSKFV
ncbi:hypothetical protein Hanom_Chr05g00411451 [Helianthus anomalus]